MWHGGCCKAIPAVRQIVVCFEIFGYFCNSTILIIYTIYHKHIFEDGGKGYCTYAYDEAVCGV